MTKKKNEALYTSTSQLWETPQEVLDLVRKVGPITLDPCSTVSNPTGARRVLTPEDDGLSHPWNKVGLNYVNPPYKYCKEWVVKAVAESSRGCEIVALIPARTDTRYWQDWIFPTAKSICFWKGRIKFLDPTGGGESVARHPAPMPTALIYWGNQQGQLAFDTVFSTKGRIVHTR